jgi:hypothetical protein
MKELSEKISLLLGRDIEVEEVTFKGQKGFLPIYFNYTFKNNVSEVFDTNKEKCLEKFYNFLVQKDIQGDTDGTNTEGERQPS